MCRILSSGSVLITVSNDIITPQDFAQSMSALGDFPPCPILAVAVSGGPDSMALTLLLDQWATKRGGQVIGLTVDHGLRPGAAQEAAQVGQWLQARNIRHHILHWSGPKPQTSIQAAARQARYDLMGQWCQSHDIGFLALGHQLEDQAETLLLRLRQESGLDGLAGMASIRPTHAVQLVRPLLKFSRRRLLATLDHWGQDYVTDPSNQNLKFERVRMRHLMADLGLSAQGLGDLAQTLTNARRTMNALVDHAEKILVSSHPMGFSVLDGAGLRDAPPEIGLRLLARLVGKFGGQYKYPPRSDRLRRLYGTLSGTLAGCRLIPQPDGLVLLCRDNRGWEPPKPLDPGQSLIWDGRFRVTSSPQTPHTIMVGALGLNGWQQVKSQKGLRVPVALRHSLPAIWYKENVLCVPHLGYKSEDSACIFVDCHYFSIEALRQT